MKNSKDIQIVQELLEVKDFEVLNTTEKAIVLNVLSEKEYKEQRHVILTATTLFAEANVHEPKPLIIPSKPSVLLAPVPLYQALLGIAAIALLMILIVPLKKIQMPNQNVKYVTVYDTLEVEKTIYDTIERIVEKPILRERLVYVDQSENMKPIEEEPRLLEVPRHNRDLSFSNSTIQNKGVSMKEETTLISLPKVF